MAAIYLGSTGNPVANLTNFVVRYPGVNIETHPQRVFRTAYGHKKVYKLGVRLQRYPCEMMFTSNTQWSAFETFFRAQINGSNLFLWSRDGTGSDVVTASFADPEFQHSIPFPGIHEVSVTLEELPVNE